MDQETIYSRALSEAGEGKFQKRFDITYNLILAALWSVAYNSVWLVLVITPHKCDISETSNKSVDLKFKYLPIENFTTTHLSSCFIYENYNASNVSKACNNYEYDTTWYASTIPSDNDWVCDKEIYVANVLSSIRVGEIVGSFFFGWFGDIYGRRMTYILSLVLFIMGRIISLLTSQYIILFAIGCVISCFPSTSAVQSTALISIEISQPQRRSKMAKLRMIANSIGLCVMPFLYWALKDWKPFFIFTTALIIPFLIHSRICVSISYTVNLLRSGEKTDGNPFLEFAWQSLAEIPGYFVGAWLADRIGRRYTGAVSSTFTGLFWIFLGFCDFRSITWISGGTVTTSLVILNKISLTVTYYIINLFNMELYPTTIRQSGMSLGNVISGGGSALAPYVLYLGRNYDNKLPGAVMILASLISALSAFSLPETLNVRLPETLEEARIFGKKSSRIKQSTTLEVLEAIELHE